MTRPLCRGSGIILGGYVREHSVTTIPIMCVACWKYVDAVPIEPERRTDLYRAFRIVYVARKQVVDHPAPTKLWLWWRLDATRQLATAFFVVGWLTLVLDVSRWFNER